MNHQKRDYSPIATVPIVMTASNETCTVRYRFPKNQSSLKKEAMVRYAESHSLSSSVERRIDVGVVTK